MFDTEAIHAQIPSNIQPNYQVDDIIVTQTPNHAASHGLYAKALAQVDQT